MVAGEARKGMWSFSADVMYLDLSQDIDEFITPRVELKKLNLEAWITTPAIGYNVLESDRHPLWRLSTQSGRKYICQHATDSTIHEDSFHALCGPGPNRN